MHSSQRDEEKVSGIDGARGGIPESQNGEAIRSMRSGLGSKHSFEFQIHHHQQGEPWANHYTQSIKWDGRLEILLI